MTLSIYYVQLCGRHISLKNYIFKTIKLICVHTFIKVFFLRNVVFNSAFKVAIIFFPMKALMKMVLSIQTELKLVLVLQKYLSECSLNFLSHAVKLSNNRQREIEIVSEKLFYFPFT